MNETRSPENDSHTR